jgi:hypothetical protein
VRSKTFRKNFINFFKVRFKLLNWRSAAANLMMLSFIIMTSVGAALITPAAGFITAGVCCGIFGYLLGSE